MMASKAPNPDPKKIVERGYDRVAHTYAGLEGSVQWPRLKWLQDLLGRLTPGTSVLDLGCGAGDPADIEIARHHKVTGVDISRTQIELARWNVPGGNFIHGDAGSVVFPPGTFDAVVSFYTIEHIPRREHLPLLRRIHGWLRAGGYLLLSLEAGDYDDVHGEWLGVPMFISSFPPEKMKELVAEAGFALVETAIETQMERDIEIPYLWVLARKP